MLPQFLYFDLGKVLVDFSIERMCRQMGEAAGVEPTRVYQTLFDGGIEQQYETGRLTSRQFHALFCERTGSQVDFAALMQAGNDIFTINPSMAPVAAQLAQAGYPLGILSNTCESHWEYCRRRYRTLDEDFQVHALSFRIGACKPDAAIFRAAAEMAGRRPEEIFYVDDLPGHVAGACAAGFDAVQYTSTPALVAELRKRELRFNY